MAEPSNGIIIAKTRMTAITTVIDFLPFFEYIFSINPIFYPPNL